jgi:hypothetical protein
MKRWPLLLGLLLLAVSPCAALNGAATPKLDKATRGGQASLSPNDQQKSRSASRPVSGVGASSRLVKPAWEWSDDERLAARFDDAARLARVDAFVADRATTGAGVKTLAASTARPVDVILGSQHPELLMPYEVLGAYLRAAYGKEDAVAATARNDARSKAAQLGLPSDFLDVLEHESTSLIAILRQEVDLRLTTSHLTGGELRAQLSKLKEYEAAECPLRMQTITRLRARYGKRFDEFLYSAIAPGVFEQFTEAQDPALLRANAGGCR